MPWQCRHRASTSIDVISSDDTRGWARSLDEPSVSLCSECRCPTLAGPVLSGGAFSLRPARVATMARLPRECMDMGNLKSKHSCVIITDAQTASVALSPCFSLTMNSRMWPTPLSNLIRHTAARPTVTKSALRSKLSLPRQTLCTATPTLNARSASFLSSYRLALAASLPIVAFGLSTTRQQPVQCASASDRSYAAAAAPTGDVVPAEAESIVNVRDLSFGTVAGICVGVFVKKGLKVGGLSYRARGHRQGYAEPDLLPLVGRPLRSRSEACLYCCNTCHRARSSTSTGQPSRRVMTRS